MGSILTLESLRAVTSAFDEFTTVSDSDLDEYYKGIFPHRCQCGAEVILTKATSSHEGYTQLQCCNPDCWVKMAYRFAYFMKRLGFKGYGSTSAIPLFRELVPSFQYPTFLCIFQQPLQAIRGLNGEAYADNFELARIALFEQSWPFKDAIAALGIPDIGQNCTIFDVVKSPVCLLDFILKDRLAELCSISGIAAPKTKYYLYMARIDIVTLMVDIMPHISNTPNTELYVAITGSVSIDGKSMTRAEFIWECENILNKDGAPAYKIVETKAESKLEYVIADTPSASSKYQLGKRLNCLITATEFYHMLLDNIGGDNNGE